VELVVRTPSHIDRAVMADLLPAGLELEDDTFETRSKAPYAAALMDGFTVPSGRAELRDDRWLWFGALSPQPNGVSNRLTYRVRAVTPGVYAVPSVVVEDMYNPDLRGSFSPGGTLTIE
jgi:uncharacterized protein YfaS (alpha-2-macroglobulin family)